MSTLTLELPDEQMQALERVAQQRGTSVNAIVAELIGTLAPIGGESNGRSDIPDDYDVTQDSIYNIKAHDTGSPGDLSLNHDHYLYGAPKRG